VTFSTQKTQILYYNEIPVNEIHGDPKKK